MSEIIRYLSFSDWLTSLSTMLSRFIHAVTKGKISFSYTHHQQTYEKMLDISNHQGNAT